MTAPTGWAMVINNLLFNLNILTIAVITGLVANKAKAATDNYINSNGEPCPNPATSRRFSPPSSPAAAVIERNHIVILVDQWSDFLIPIIRQLRIAAADPAAATPFRRPVLILTGRPKTQAQPLINAAAAASATNTATSGPLRRLEIIVRQGDPRLAADLDRVCAGRAARVALIAADADRAAPAGPAVRRKLGVAAALLRQLRPAPPRPAAVLALPRPAAAGGWRWLEEDFAVLEDDEFLGRLLGVLARPSQVWWSGGQQGGRGQGREGMELGLGL
jgi:hypothetical protein